MRFWAALVLLGIGWIQPVSASEHSVFERSCTLASDQRLTLDQVSARTDWKCNPQSEDAEGRHSWVRIDGADLPSGTIRLESSATAYEGILVAIRSRDGSVSSQYFDSTDLARNWTAGTLFSLPLELGDTPPAQLLVRIDEPIGPQVAAGIVLVSPEVAERQKVRTLSLLSIFLGILTVVSLLGGLMARAIRRKFALYHLGFSLLLMVYTISSTSLIYLVLPDLSLWVRSIISYASLAWAMVLLAPFIFDFFEEGTIPLKLKKVMSFTALLAFIAGFILPVGNIWGIYPRHLYNIAFIPGLLVIPLAVAIAWHRGSKAARAFALAWAVPLIVAADRILRGLDLYTLPTSSDLLLYAAMALEAFGMTAAIVLRVSDMRQERDRAIQQTQELDQQARHDQLTGLANRRDFDERRWRQSDYLAIVDLDRFKLINDRYGHETGDRVLQVVGRLLSEVQGKGEVLCAWRLGGEEFAIAMEADSIEDAALRLNTIRARIPGMITAIVPEIEGSVTASAGMSKIGSEVRQAYRAADSALYHAKGGGRNRLCYESGVGALATIFPRPLAA